jgi:hypothetical protein
MYFQRNKNKKSKQQYEKPRIYYSDDLVTQFILINRPERIVLTPSGNCHIKCPHKDVSFEGYCKLFETYLVRLKNGERQRAVACKECPQLKDL